jgi:hypothetical protein
LNGLKFKISSLIHCAGDKIICALIRCCVFKIAIEADQWNIAQVVLIETQNDNIFEGNEDINVTISSTSDDTHYNISKNIIVQLEEDDPEPVPPPVNCPKSPNKINRIEWCWSSGGGTNLFRYQFDDDDLTIGAELTGSFCQEDLYSLPDGLHTFYIQEYNEFTKQWSESSVCDIEIDTGSPCSKLESPVAVTAQSKQFTITYKASDCYDETSCWYNTSGSGLSEIQLWVASPENPAFHLYAVDQSEQLEQCSIDQLQMI